MSWDVILTLCLLFEVLWIKKVSLVRSLPELTADTDLKPIYGHSALSGFSLEEINALLAKTSAEADSAAMFMQMYSILDHLDFTELALEMQDKALALQQVFRIHNSNVKSDEKTLRLMAFVGRGNLSDNAPLDYITDHCNIQLDLVYILDDLQLPPQIPDHDAVIVALGEKDCHLAVLDFMQSLKSIWPRPWLNDPEHIRLCARDLLYERLKDIPDMIVPITVRVSRRQINLPYHPITIRPINTHSGKGLQRICHANDLEDYLNNNDAKAFYISRFYPTDRTDGLYRKLRIALIDGKPYICHVALSDQWIVHYISAQMHLNADKIAEEKALMETFETNILDHHRITFQRIATAIGLDFVVLDCEITSQNQIIIYEADNRGWIHSTDNETIFPYKKSVMTKAFAAFRDMVLCRMDA